MYMYVYPYMNIDIPGLFQWRPSDISHCGWMKMQMFSTAFPVENDHPPMDPRRFDATKSWWWLTVAPLCWRNASTGWFYDVLHPGVGSSNQPSQGERKKVLMAAPGWNQHQPWLTLGSLLQTIPKTVGSPPLVDLNLLWKPYRVAMVSPLPFWDDHGPKEKYGTWNRSLTRLTHQSLTVFFFSKISRKKKQRPRFVLWLSIYSWIAALLQFVCRSAAILPYNTPRSHAPGCRSPQI